MRLITALQVLCLSWGFQLSAQAHSIAKRSQEKVLDAAHAVVANAIPENGVICWPQGFSGADEQATLYNIIKLAHDPNDKAVLISPAKSCTIKTCHNEAALIVCNDNDYPISTTAQSLGYLAWRIIHRNDCGNDNSDVCGQQFSRGGWNVILRHVSQEECDSGVLARDVKENHDGQ